MTGTRNNQQGAMAQGRAAFRYGKPIEDCPHKTPESIRQFKLGWLQMKREWEGKKDDNKSVR